MRYKLRLSALLFLSLLVLSFCKEKPQESVNSKKDFVVSDKIKSLELPSKIGHFNMQSFQDEHSFLYFFDYKTNGLLIYSLENDQLEKHLVFLDSDFNKIGELDLEENQFNGTYIFSNQEGIWVSTDHPDNPELSEDFLKFRLILLNDVR